MRQRSSDLPQAVRELLTWASAQDAVSPLGGDQVPGTDDAERRALAALGGLARALVASGDRADWPETVTAWSQGAPSPPASAVAAIKAELGQEPDRLALLYERLVSGRNRRRLGTFFTPTPLVRYMLKEGERILGQPPATVIDPGAGVGAFAVAAHEVWRDAEIHAVDVNVVTLGLMAARAAAQGRAGRLRLWATDFLPWSSEVLPDLDAPRLILGNPPYTRHQEMSAKDKAEAKNAAGGLVTSGLAGLSAYFLAASIQRVGANGALCLLLPGNWTEARYGREIRERLWFESKRRVELHSFPSEVEVFPGTQVTAMILLVGPREKNDQPLVHIDAQLKGDRVIARATLRHRVRRGDVPGFARPRTHAAGTASQQAVPLGDMAIVRRGVATGANEFFFLSDEQADQFGRRFCRRALVKPAYAPWNELTITKHDLMGQVGRRRWLLDLNDYACEDAAIEEYLKYGISRGFHRRHLTTLRPAWFRVEQVAAPDIIVATVGKENHRVILNSAGAVPSNAMAGISLRDFAPYPAIELAEWLRSPDGQIALRREARQYSGGSLKIEPGVLKRVLVPVPAGWTLH